MENIVKFLATGFYSGLSPKAPGTVGSVTALGIYIVLGMFFKNDISVIITIIFAAGVIPATIVCNMAEKIYGEKDPQKVVIDEFFGQWLTFIFLPFSIKAAFIGFILFRIFDILKPFPINVLQKIRGGIGIMIDDLLAGLFAAVILHGILYYEYLLPVKIF